jgi:large subunit ribosomal protein L22
MEAKLLNYRQSPRKVRLLADLVRGKKYSQAVLILSHTSKRAVEPVLKVLQSAGANAVHNHGANIDNLVVTDIRVDKGIVMKRFMPRARGSASRINKRSSHVYIKLTDSTQGVVSSTKVVTEKVTAKAAPKATAKKPAAKKTTKATKTKKD